MSATEPSGRGVYGPDSVTWRVHTDPLVGLAVLRSLLLQALHPVVMQALDQHSHYGADPWLRLAHTTDYVAVTTYGTATQAMMAASRVRAVHTWVAGQTDDGFAYSAEDPQLLAWGHSCLVASILELVTRGGLRLSGADQDAYVAEQARSAALLGLEPAETPHDRAELLDYFRTIRPALACSPAARQAARTVVSAPVPAGPGRPPRPSWAAVAGLAHAALPGWARRLYALTDVPPAAGLPESGTTVALRALRTTLAGVRAVQQQRTTGMDGRPAPR